MSLKSLAILSFWVFKLREITFLVPIPTFPTEHSMKGQTWVEFIVATSIFLLAIGFIFITATGNLKEEMQKAQQQTSCLKAYELENFLSQPGIPANWTYPSSFTVFGLASGNRTQIVVSNDKWQAMKNFGFANISQNSTPSQSWKLGYDVYAFGMKADSNCTFGNAITLCRGSSNLNITANSTSKSTIKLKLYFPFSNATLGSSTNESDDSIVITSSANGTYVTLTFNTNSTDQDFLNLSLSPNPKLIFIEQFSIEGGQYLPFYLGNVLLQDSFGPFSPPNAMICNTKVSGLLNLTNETLIADFNLEAW